jgi:hypothetical protein
VSVELSRQFSKEDIQMTKKIHEEMLNIPGHTGNANQNYIEIPPHPSQNGYHQKHKQKQILARIWGERNPIYCWWECELVQPLWKAVWRLLKKLKN